MSKPLDLYNSFKDEGYGSRFGDVSIPQLLELIGHHKIRRIGASSEHFGVLDISKAAATRYVQQMLPRVEQFEQRILDEKNEVCHVRAGITLRPRTGVKMEAWDLNIFRIRGVIPSRPDSYWVFYG